MNCGVYAFEPLSPRKAHRGGTVRHYLSIKGHDHADRMGEANTSPCFLSRGSSRLLRYLLFCLLFLFVYLLFPTLVLILLAFVSHCVPPFPVTPHLLAARVPLHRQFCLCVFSLSSDGWNEWLGTMCTEYDFLFLGPRHRFYLRFSNKSFGTRQTFLLI